MTPSYHLGTGRARVAWNELRVNFWRKVGFQLQYNAGSLEQEEEEEDFYYLNLLVVHGRHMSMYNSMMYMYMYITLSTPYQTIMYNVFQISSVHLMQLSVHAYSVFVMCQLHMNDVMYVCKKGENSEVHCTCSLFRYIQYIYKRILLMRQPYHIFFKIKYENNLA